MSRIFVHLYILFLIIFVCSSYLFVDTNLIYLKSLYSGYALSHRLEVTIGYLLFICLFAYAEYKLIKLVELKKMDFINFKKITLIAVSVLILSYPAVISYDIFNYMNTAKVTYEYHENPYIVMPIDIPNNTYNLFTRAANKTALYGPVWIALTSIPHFLSNGNFIISMYLFKILVAIFYGGICYLLWKLSKDAYIVAFFALNPLVLLETFVSSHNDVVMMFFALLSYYLFAKKRMLLGMGAFILSILIKFSSIFLLPVVIYLIFSYYSKRKIDWQRMYIFSAILMGIIFLLSPLREEMYPWYFIWVIPFISLVKKKNISILVYAFSFGLLLRYIPYMLLGSYDGLAAVLRILLMITPLLITGIFLWTKKVR